VKAKGKKDRRFTLSRARSLKISLRRFKEGGAPMLAILRRNHPKEKCGM